MLFHYVYRVDWEPFYYIGVRSSRVEPELDVEYLGSGVWVLCNMKWAKPVKTILSRHETRLEAEEEESRLLLEHVGKMFCRNRRRSGPRRRRTACV